MSYYFHGESSPANSPTILEDSSEQEIYVPKFSIIQEALKFYGINVVENTRENFNINNTLSDPKIKKILYSTLVEELKTGNTHLLEFVLSEKLLKQEELIKYGIHSQRETAILILKNMKGQQRARDIDSFLESGMITQKEAQELKYSVI